MNEVHLKKITAITLTLGAIVWLILYFIQGFEPISFSSLKSLFSGFTFIGLFWAIYFRWAWKWPYMRNILYKPNINGTWLGHFKSNWRDDNGNLQPQKKFVLVIRQTWLTLSIKAFTEIQKTNSHIESLIFDDSKGTKILAYLFSEKDNTSDGDLRKGAAELDLAEGDDLKILEGNFWTLAGTNGFVRVSCASSKEQVDSFQMANVSWGNENSWVKIEG